MLSFGDVILIALCSSLFSLVMICLLYWLLVKPSIERALDKRAEFATNRIEQFISSQLTGSGTDLSPEAFRSKAILAAKTGAGLMEGSINKVFNTLGGRSRSTVESSSGDDS